MLVMRSALILAAALIVTACSSSSESASPTTAAVEATTTTVPPPVVTVSRQTFMAVNDCLDNLFNESGYAALLGDTSGLIEEGKRCDQAVAELAADGIRSGKLVTLLALRETARDSMEFAIDNGIADENRTAEFDRAWIDVKNEGRELLDALYSG